MSAGWLGITASYATGSVSGRGNYVGGLVGNNSSRGSYATPRQRKAASYATGSVSGRGSSVGGLVGGKRRRHHRQLRHRQRKRQGQRKRQLAGWPDQTAAPSPPATTGSVSGRGS